MKTSGCVIVCSVLYLAASGCESGSFGAAAHETRRTEDDQETEDKGDLDAVTEETAGAEKAPPKAVVEPGDDTVVTAPDLEVEDEAPPPPTKVETLADLRAACKSLTETRFNIDLAFPASGACDPKLSQVELKDQMHEATQQRQPLGLPKGVVLCDLTFAIEAPIVFDDELFVDFSGLLLFGTFDLSKRLPEQDGLRRLTWEKVRGTPYDGDVITETPPICAWGAAPGGRCRITGKGSGSSDRNTADIHFPAELPPALEDPLLASGLKGDPASVGVLTVDEGDGRCYHEAMIVRVSGAHVTLAKP